MTIHRLLAAARFAATCHQKQRRKDKQQTPYINHPIEVAELLARQGITDPDLLCAALLHDTVEDTPASLSQIEELFGKQVGRLVNEVTDDKTLPKRERKQQQIVNAPHKSLAAQQLKLADKICNIRTMDLQSPHDWDLARKQEYLAWAEQVVAGLRGAHPALERLFDEELARAQNRLKPNGTLPPTIPFEGN